VKSSDGSLVAPLDLGVAAGAALGHSSIPDFVTGCVAATTAVDACEFSPDGCVGAWTGTVATEGAPGLAFSASSDA
jgi:hypothetical protein